MADDFLPNFETIELDSPTPNFAEAEYTVPKTESTTARMGGINLGSISVSDAEAPYGYNADGSVRKRRGRPPGSKNQNITGKLATARDAKEVSKRLEQMLVGATGVLTVVRPHLQMTDNEASNIADPLSAYLVRQEQFSPRIKEFIDHYDLAAAGIAFLAYLVRVYRDDVDYRKQRQATDVVEAVSNRRTSRRRNEADDATTSANDESRESATEDGSERTQSDAGNLWFPTPYIAGD